MTRAYKAVCKVIDSQEKVRELLRAFNDVPEDQRAEAVKAAVAVLVKTDKR